MNLKKAIDLQKEFESTGYTSWINSDLYPDGKIYTQEYTQWLESKVIEAAEKSLKTDAEGKSVQCNNCGVSKTQKTYDGYWCKMCHNVWLCVVPTLIKLLH